MLQAISRRLRRPHCGSSSFTIPSRCRDRRLSLWPRRSHQPSSRRIIPPPPGDFPFKYWVIDNVENLELYTAGGLHPVWLDDILHDRYQIVDKLGYGGNSTVWLGHDLLEKRYVALKIGRSAKISDADEAATIRQLSTFQKGSINQAGGLIPAILDEFSIHGPNGTHQCLVTKPMEGSLRQAKGYGALFPMPVARVLVARLCLAVQFVHSRGFVHGDIHLGNAFISLSFSIDGLSIEQFRKMYGEAETEPIRRMDGRGLGSRCPSLAILPLYLGDEAKEFQTAHAQRLMLADFGEAFQPGVKPRLGRDSHIPVSFRAPEAHFEPDQPMSFESDIWSLATAIWHIMGMKNVFHNRTRDQTHITPQQVDVLNYDALPTKWKTIREQTEVEDEEREPCPPLNQAFHECIQEFRLESKTAGVFEEDEVKAFLALIRGMLRFRPEERLTAEQVLETEWMTNWALPALRES